MTDITTTTETPGKRMRNGSVILTDRMCQKRVAKRTKIYDRKCPGLYVSITTAGVATFSFKFTDPETGKQRTGWLGVFNPETFTVEDARSKAYGLKALGGKAIAETLRQHKAQKVKLGVTVDQVIAERVEWMRTLVLKRDGEMRPRIETWSNVESHLRRFVSPRLGKKLANEVSNRDIAQLLAIKFALVTMLRSAELLGIHRDELNAENGTVDIPARRVKKRRVINQPLSNLALEIITEAMGNYDFAFVGRFGDAPLARNAMASALQGTKKLVKGVKVARTPGICELLGLAPFTPHDLRRTAATMCGRLRLPESNISLCLDHQPTKDENGKALPAITSKVYNHDVEARVLRKREVLDAWAIELQRIISEVSVKNGPAALGLLAA